MKEGGRPRAKDGEACVAVVTGPLHRNDFNRSFDTHRHSHGFLHTEKLVDAKLSAAHTDESRHHK